MKSPRSLPAENAPGTPMIRTQRIGADPPAVSIASAIASYIADVSAFFLSGRFIRIVRIAPSSLTITWSVMGSPFVAAGFTGSSERRIGNGIRALGDRRLQPTRLHGNIL